jgi:outer membrane protein
MMRSVRIGAMAAMGAVLLAALPAFAQGQQAPRPAPAQAPASAPAEQPVRVKLATLDIDAIQRDASAIKDIRAQIEKFQETFRAEIEKENTALRDADQELRRQRTILAPEAFTAERQKFEARVAEVQRLSQKRRTDLDTSFRNAMQTVQKTLNDVVEQTAKDAEITLIIRTDQLVFRHPGLDITKVVLDRLNQKLAKVKVAPPGKE